MICILSIICSFSVYRLHRWEQVVEAGSQLIMQLSKYSFSLPVGMVDVLILLSETYFNLER